MCKQFIAFLSRRIKAHWVIHLVIHTKRNLLVSTVDRRAGSIHQMLHRIMAAGFKDIVETDDIAFNIHIRVVDEI